MKCRVDLFRSAVTQARIAGVLPKERKQVLDRVYQLWPLLLLVPVFLSQLFALFRYWGDTVLVLDIVGMMAVILLGTWANIWCASQNKRILKMVEYLETESVLSSPLVQQNFTLKQIVQVRQRKCHLVSRGIGCSICLAFIFWITSPIVIAYLQKQEHPCQRKESNHTLTPRELYQQDGYDQFSFPMWLPLDSTEWYTEIWILQMICYLGAFRTLFPLSRILIVIFVAAGVQCEILAELVSLVSKCHDDPELAAGHGMIESTENTAKNYLKRLIKLHQHVLKMSKDMDSLQSLLTGPSLGLLMVINITSMFQLTVSERIGKEAYGSNWYERSTEFKRLVHMMIFRCQRPCVWTVLQVIDIKVVAFADVTLVCYRVFMLLLQVEDTGAAIENTCLQ